MDCTMERYGADDYLCEFGFSDAFRDAYVMARRRYWEDAESFGWY